MTAPNLTSAYRWLEDALRAAKDWDKTDNPPEGPPYLSHTTCENLRTSVRVVRAKRREIQRTTEDLQAAGETYRVLRVQLESGPVGLKHRSAMRRVADRVERLRLLLAEQEEALVKCRALLQTRAQAVRRAIENAEAKARPQPLKRTRAEAQAEGVATKKSNAEAARIKAKAEQEHADTLLALEIAPRAPQRVKDKVAATIRAAQPKGCHNCAHGRAQPAAQLGFECVPYLTMACKPLANLARWEPKP